MLAANNTERRGLNFQVTKTEGGHQWLHDGILGFQFISDVRDCLLVNSDEKQD